LPVAAHFMTKRISQKEQWALVHFDFAIGYLNVGASRDKYCFWRKGYGLKARQGRGVSLGLREIPKDRYKRGPKRRILPHHDEPRDENVSSRINSELSPVLHGNVRV